MIAIDDPIDPEDRWQRHHFLRTFESVEEAWTDTCRSLSDVESYLIGLALGDRVAVAKSLVEVESTLRELMAFVCGIICVRVNDPNLETRLTDFIDFPAGITEFGNEELRRRSKQVRRRSKQVHNVLDDQLVVNQRMGVFIPTFGPTPEAYMVFHKRQPGYAILERDRERPAQIPTSVGFALAVEGKGKFLSGKPNFLRRRALQASLPIRWPDQPGLNEDITILSWDEQNVLGVVGPLYRTAGLVMVSRTDPCLLPVRDNWAGSATAFARP